MTFMKACEAVLTHCPDPYAKAYAKAGLDHQMEGEEQQVQCLYILSNMSHWRGDIAKEARATLKRLAKK